eukprot:383391-Rhodomonas_salina.1
MREHSVVCVSNICGGGAGEQAGAGAAAAVGGLSLHASALVCPSPPLPHSSLPLCAGGACAPRQE